MSMEKERGKWIKILVGELQTSPGNYEYEGGQWKRGLIVNGVTIRPKSYGTIACNQHKKSILLVDKQPSR
ncbi:Phloem protein 2-like, partial [Dillenia turbinata]